MITRGLALVAGIVLVWCALLTGCARDSYQRRADLVKSHTAAFYQHLERGQVAGAIAENERIEDMARKLEEGLAKQATAMDANQKAREWLLIKTTNQTAIDNWLNLGRYFSQTKRYDQARGTYQRVVETYQGKDAAYTPFVERARSAIRDVDLMLAPARNP